MSKISLIVATDLEGTIGREDRIPWRIRDDLVRLKDLTLDRVIIIGRKTYDSMVTYYIRSNRPMPGKVYVVMTRNRDYRPEGNAVAAYSLDEALLIAESIGDDEVFCSGGGLVFEAVLPYAQQVYLTEVKTVAEGDSKFPTMPQDEWREVSRESHAKDDRNEFDFDYVVYERIK